MGECGSIGRPWRILQESVFSPPEHDAFFLPQFYSASVHLELLWLRRFQSLIDVHLHFLVSCIHEFFFAGFRPTFTRGLHQSSIWTGPRITLCILYWGNHRRTLSLNERHCFAQAMLLLCLVQLHFRPAHVDKEVATLSSINISIYQIRNTWLDILVAHQFVVNHFETACAHV